MELRRSLHFELTIPEPFNFKLTVAKPAGWNWSTPGEIFENGTLWSGLYLAKHPVGLKLSAEKNSVRVVAYSNSILKPDMIIWLKESLEFGLGSEEDLDGFYAFAAKDEILSITVKDLHGMRAGRLDDVFGRVILAILLQMAPLTRSQKMMQSVLDNYGTAISFDRKKITLWPLPEEIAAIEPAKLQAKSNIGYRAGRLVKAASYLAEHPLTLAELSNLDEEEAVTKLTEIPGVGEYSADIIYGRTAAPLDSWSVVIMSELILGKTPTDPRKDIPEVTWRLKERWGKWSWMAFVYILNDLEKLASVYNLSRIR